jgi:hypothetical protein
MSKSGRRDRYSRMDSWPTRSQVGVNQWRVFGEVGSQTDYTIQQKMTGLAVGKIYNLTFSIPTEQGFCSEGQASLLSVFNGSPRRHSTVLG